MYNAIVTKGIPKKHPNGDRIQLLEVFGTNVVVGLDITENDLGIYFPSDGQLSEEYAKANDLIGYTDEQGNKKGGFFSENRRVRAQKFRGEKSDGFWMPIQSLAFTGVDVSKLKQGDLLVEVNGIPICNKYETPSTKKANAQGKQKGPRKTFPGFPKHYDTSQYSHNKTNIPKNSQIVITEKLHGTSGRTGYVRVFESTINPWWKRLFGPKYKITSEYRYVTGSRNIVLKDGSPQYYESESFRDKASNLFTGRLHKDEVVYYEIVGFTDSGQKIMPSHPTSKMDKEFIKEWGDHVDYLYGCEYKPDIAKDGVKPFEVYVYRIATVNEDGVINEYPWNKVKQRCKELGVKHVPELRNFKASNYMAIDKSMEKLKGTHSTIDDNTLCEGLVMRISPRNGHDYWLKEKSFEFKVLEGIIKDSDTYVDMEEIS
jgi:hypothetical protein